MVQDNKEVVEKPTSSAASDPFTALYEALAAEGHRRRENWSGKRPPVRFRASEAGGCPRQIWHRLMGHRPAPESADLILKQIEGNIQQDVIRSLFKEYDIPIRGIEFQKDGTQKETMDTRRMFTVVAPDGTKTDVLVSVRADGAVDSPRGDALFEFKTLDHYKTHWLQVDFTEGGNDAAVDRVMRKHGYWVMQMQISMAVFDKERTLFGFRNCSHRSYVMRQEDGTRVGLYIDRDQKIVDTVLDKFAMVKQCVADGKPPAFEHCPIDGSAICGWCPFYYRCYGEINRRQRKLEPAILYPGDEE